MLSRKRYKETSKGNSMSMYRQMWLAIILSTLMSMLGGLLVSTLNARSYLSEQLSAKNTDNATALALALSQQNASAVMIELTVAALFDGGHYELIRVVDPLGKPIVERASPAEAREVPGWFVKILPLSATPGQAQISNGWNQMGTLTLISNSRFAYEALWKSVVQLVLALGFAGLVGGCLGTMVLRRLREPLQRVIDQATAISHRRFLLIDVPDVPELKQLAMAMNSTVTRLKSMFTEEAHRLEALRVTANYDPLTGLANRTFFFIQLLGALDNEEATGSSLLLVRTADFHGLSVKVGAAKADDVLKALADTLSQHASQNQGVAARVGDADFALLLPSRVNASLVAEELLRSLIHARGVLTGDDDPAAYIGLAKLQRGQDIGGLMAQASAALATAETSGTASIAETGHSEEDILAGEEFTAQLIRAALAQGHARLSLAPVVDLKGGVIHLESALELMLEGDQEWQEAGRFRQIAAHFDLLPELDRLTLQLGLDHLKRTPAPDALAITLSASILQDEQLRTQVLGLLGGNPGPASRLRLQAFEGDVLPHLPVFSSFVAEVHRFGTKVGLVHFGRQFNQSGLLHDLGLDFLKVDASFIRGLAFNADNQVFLKGLASVAQKMDMQIYAEGVIDHAELEALTPAGFNGAAGPAVERRSPK